ncbi:hypothetical protein GLAREA_05163 [Glarea lozoyensis ATCC 20868]|uniref:Uncharacterized protein n=1 Tax=Glarea lozoyensis (strain ATCC 20868 / MF5171) TaxID=1116229 RepID=S3DDN1_GLAL2|nr:uncharacterized protein GLAREA_05163 [Glarea lozoyensis ATCC 20868]EPE35825.1 hypothetical protein GLAREA_05163 [Glarea lozoyensis ATCC 20868]
MSTPLISSKANLPFPKMVTVSIPPTTRTTIMPTTSWIKVSYTATASPTPTAFRSTIIKESCDTSTFAGQVSCRTEAGILAVLFILLFLFLLGIIVLFIFLRWQRLRRESLGVNDGGENGTAQSESFGMRAFDRARGLLTQRPPTAVLPSDSERSSAISLLRSRSRSSSTNSAVVGIKLVVRRGSELPLPAFPFHEPQSSESSGSSSPEAAFPETAFPLLRDGPERNLQLVDEEGYGSQEGEFEHVDDSRSGSPEKREVSGRNSVGDDVFKVSGEKTKKSKIKMIHEVHHLSSIESEVEFDLGSRTSRANFEGETTSDSSNSLPGRGPNPYSFPGSDTKLADDEGNRHGLSPKSIRDTNSVCSFPCSHEELAQEEYHIQYPSETGVRETSSVYSVPSLPSEHAEDESNIRSQEEEDVSTSEQPSITEVASMRGSPHSSTSSSTTSLPKSEDEFVVIALDESGGKVSVPHGEDTVILQNKKMGPREGHEA